MVTTVTTPPVGASQGGVNGNHSDHAQGPETAIVAYQAVLGDTQDEAEILLYTEARLGEMIKAIPDKKASSGGGTCSLPDGVNKKQSHYAQELSENEDAIAEVVAKARDSGKVPVCHIKINQMTKSWSFQQNPPKYNKDSTAL